MSGSEPAMSQATSEARLDDWLELMNPRLEGLRAWLQPKGFPFDFSLASVGQLETHLLDEFEDIDAVTAAPAGDRVERVMGYLGEALLRAGGGSWGWYADTDLPIVLPDDDLGLDPISPLHLIADAVRRRTGTVLTEALEAVQGAVASRQDDLPGWAPTKQLTPGVDDILTVLPSEFLDAWLPEREAAFPLWIAEYGGGDAGRWDFSPESLDALEELVRRVIGAAENFSEPKYRDFVEGAAWYLGEVMRRAHDAHWCHIEGEPDPHSPWVGRPYIDQLIQDGHATVPVLDIANALLVRRPGFLREMLERFTY